MSRKLKEVEVLPEGESETLLGLAPPESEA
jgi:hypothetical protein